MSLEINAVFIVIIVIGLARYPTGKGWFETSGYRNIVAISIFICDIQPIFVTYQFSTECVQLLAAFKADQVTAQIATLLLSAEPAELHFLLNIIGL